MKPFPPHSVQTNGPRSVVRTDPPVQRGGAPPNHVLSAAKDQPDTDNAHNGSNSTTTPNSDSPVHEAKYSVSSFHQPAQLQSNPVNHQQQHQEHYRGRHPLQPQFPSHASASSNHVETSIHPPVHGAHPSPMQFHHPQQQHQVSSQLPGGWSTPTTTCDNIYNRTYSAQRRKTIFDHDARSLLHEERIQNPNAAQKRNLILEVHARNLIAHEWNLLLDLLGVTIQGDVSHELKNDYRFVEKLEAEWRQLTTIYWLASQRVKDRFQCRSRTENLDVTMNTDKLSPAMRQFFEEYKHAQLTLVGKAEQRLRSTLRLLFDNATQDIAYRKCEKPRIETSTSLVIYLQQFIVDNITFPYMSEDEINQVVKTYLMDKQRVKRKLQNMRTRIWKPFVIEKGLLEPSMFKAGNQLKKFLSNHSERVKSSEWQKAFQQWIEEKRRPNWNYGSDK